MPSLEPLKSGEGAAGNAGQAEAGSSTSFRERKLSQLQGEEQPKPGRAQDLQAESDEDGYPDDEDRHGSVDLLDDEDDASDLDDESENESDDDELLDDEDEDEDAEGDEDLTLEDLKAEKLRLEQKISKLTENRKQIEADFRDSTTENITFRHEMEDTVEQIRQQGGFWLQLAQAQVQRFENLDWSQVPPDQMGAVKAQAQKAVQYRDQIVQRFQAMEQKHAEAKEAALNRQAEVSRNILARQIDGWSNEKYAAVREHAVKNHWSPEEFNDITDWRIIRMLHRDLERERAVETVQQVKRKRKAKAPGQKTRQRVPRSADGRYRSAKAEAHAHPGDKSRFRRLQEAKLARERKGR